MRRTIRTNTATEENEVILRKNGVDTLLKITIGSTDIGDFNDFSNQVTVVAGDQINWLAQPTGATGTGNIKFEFISVEFE